MIAMIGTSDRLCWLAETCKILLLLLIQFANCMIRLILLLRQAEQKLAVAVI